MDIDFIDDFIDFKEDEEDDDDEEDRYSEENIQERKMLRASCYPKRKKPYYPPYDD